jgi:hypothetical protein
MAFAIFWRPPSDDTRHIHPCGPPLLQTFAAVAATIATATAVVIVAAISAIVPAAVVAAVVLVSPPPPPPPSLPLPLLVDCCLLFVSTAVVNRIIKLIVHNDVWYLPKNPEFEYGCLINIRGSIMYFTIPEDYHLIQHPTITEA